MPPEAIHNAAGPPITDLHRRPTQMLFKRVSAPALVHSVSAARCRPQLSYQESVVREARLGVRRTYRPRRLSDAYPLMLVLSPTFRQSFAGRRSLAAAARAWSSEVPGSRLLPSTAPGRGPPARRRYPVAAVLHIPDIESSKFCVATDVGVSRCPAGRCSQGPGLAGQGALLRLSSRHSSKETGHSTRSRRSRMNTSSSAAKAWASRISTVSANRRTSSAVTRGRAVCDELHGVGHVQPPGESHARN